MLIALSSSKSVGGLGPVLNENAWEGKSKKFGLPPNREILTDKSWEFTTFRSRISEKNCWECPHFCWLMYIFHYVYPYNASILSSKYIYGWDEESSSGKWNKHLLSLSDLFLSFTYFNIIGKILVYIVYILILQVGSSDKLTYFLLICVYSAISKSTIEMQMNWDIISLCFYSKINLGHAKFSVEGTVGQILTIWQVSMS